MIIALIAATVAVAEPAAPAKPAATSAPAAEKKMDCCEEMKSGQGCDCCKDKDGKDAPAKHDGHAQQH